VARSDILVPDKNGKVDDVNLGLDTVADYEDRSRYFGALCGRVANRIKGASFELEGNTYKLHVNNGPNHLHGGKVGFDKQVWASKIEGTELVLTLVSPDGDEGYPGTLTTEVRYSLDDAGCFTLEYSATTDKTTVLNLTNHSYFNLAGHGSGELKDHVLMIPAESYLPLDDESIPFGEQRSVEGSAYDLREPKRLGDVMDKVPGGKAYDNNFCLGMPGVLKLAARVEHPPSGRTMTCVTTEPGIQLYTCCHLGDTAGKAGAKYGRFGAFCLEAQHYPDSVHNPGYPSTVLRPGQTYTQTTHYTFGLM